VTNLLGFLPGHLPLGRPLLGIQPDLRYPMIERISGSVSLLPKVGMVVPGISNPSRIIWSISWSG